MHAVECTITEILTHPTRLSVCLLRSPTGRMRKHARRQGMPEQSQELLSIFPWPLTRDEHTNPCGERRTILSLSLTHIFRRIVIISDRPCLQAWLAEINPLSLLCMLETLLHIYIHDLVLLVVYMCEKNLTHSSFVHHHPPLSSPPP